MTDGVPVRALAVEVLVRIERDRAFAAPLLAAKEGRVPPRDRGLLRTIVLSALRNLSLLDHVLGRHLSRPIETLDTDVRAGLRVGAAQLLLLERVPPHAAVGETVGAVRLRVPRAAGLVNAVLRKVASEGKPPRIDLGPETDPLARLALETSHPEWLVRRWVADLGLEAAEAALLSDDAEASVDVLLDPRGEDPDVLLARLRHGGLEGKRSPWAPLAVTLSSASAGSHPEIATGRLAVVDVAAQAMCELVEPAEVVVDLAAAPGGKTRTLLATGRARRVVALERNPTRTRRLAAGLQAAGRAEEVLVVRADSARPPLPRGAFRSVLLDAPCSGTGTLRKNPEIRWRLVPTDLARLAATQRALLAAALDLCAPGGSVVYVTCSLEPEENEEVVAAVVGERADVSVERPEPSRLPAPLARALRPAGVLRVAPGASNDGFTATVLRKDGGSR
ncbi:MAG: transcription antitermination factor NusB [Thermoanaerobaculia bacterium]|nr:transcription antitermination factor NusB [Thermoanaerobaculia bacterium]